MNREYLIKCIYCTFLQSGASCTSPVHGKQVNEKTTYEKNAVHRHGKYSRVRGTPTHTIINNKNKELISRVDVATDGSGSSSNTSQTGFASKGVFNVNLHVSRLLPRV